MKLSILVSGLMLLLATSCGDHEAHDHEGHDHSHGDADAHPVAVVAPTPSENASVHVVQCGCTLDGIGGCGEYIEVEGRFVRLELPVDMGAMPFCGRDGLRAKVDGALAGEVFVATTFAYVD